METGREGTDTARTRARTRHARAEGRALPPAPTPELSLQALGVKFVEGLT